MYNVHLTHSLLCFEFVEFTLIIKYYLYLVLPFTPFTRSELRAFAVFQAIDFLYLSRDGEGREEQKSMIDFVWNGFCACS